ncbi:MAG: hypothetical protein A3E87_03355 [Gammaproteobacteria bacterium RIFCSPHIGHO2_12_FULL_35_23]|nr:MAG: hypothetical protein A3E87_03355 [Gammaproteobacteria bacterium RIFCSPHIGHO2_12_FULL_35_23]
MAKPITESPFTPEQLNAIEKNARKLGVKDPVEQARVARALAIIYHGAFQEEGAVALIVEALKSMSELVTSVAANAQKFLATIDGVDEKMGADKSSLERTEARFPSQPPPAALAAAAQQAKAEKTPRPG